MKIGLKYEYLNDIQSSIFFPFPISNHDVIRHIKNVIQWIFKFLSMIHPISQSFKHIRLTHCKIKVHIHEFYKCDKKCGQKFKSSLLIEYPQFWFYFHSWKVDYDSFGSLFYYFNEFYFIYFFISREHKKNCHYDVHIKSL